MYILQEIYLQWLTEECLDTGKIAESFFNDMFTAIFHCDPMSDDFRHDIKM